MRSNQPVTQRENVFPPHYRLISATDRQGVIQHCNDEFVEVSGYSREELVGQHHNLQRQDIPTVYHMQVDRASARVHFLQ